jgi:hypothetical protein
MNPELRRNIWLELTWHRLLAMPVILALGFALAYILGEPNAGTALAWVALAMFGAISVLWGSHLASSSIIDEFRDKTWDTQRMSALSPWSLAWSKLLGANVFTWYGGSLCLAVFLLSAPGRLAGVPVLGAALLVTGLAVLTHALSMLLGLLTARAPQHRRAPANVLVLLLLLPLFFLWFAPYSTTVWVRSEPTIWYGIGFDPIWFRVVSVWLFATWAVIGLYRLLCTELQVRTVPVAWLSFGAFLTFYLAGFAEGRLSGNTLSLLVMVGFTVSLGMTYLSAGSEHRDIVTVRRFALHWRGSSSRRALQELPCWLATAPFALAFAVGLLAMNSGHLESFERLPAAFPLGLCLFALRDIGLLYFFSLARVPRRSEFTTVIYLVVVYLLLPELFLAAGWDTLANLVLPPIWSNASLGLGILVLHLALVSVLLWRRWQARRDELTSLPAG